MYHVQKNSCVACVYTNTNDFVNFGHQSLSGNILNIFETTSLTKISIFDQHFRLEAKYFLFET